MIDHMAAKVAAIGFGAAGAAVAVAGVAGDHVEVIQIVAGGTAAVIGATWATLAAFDSRMDTKIKASERRTIAQVHHLRDLLVERGVIHVPGHDESED